jgi:uncharacterized membrane protein YhiD involved in acid resistance
MQEFLNLIKGSPVSNQPVNVLTILLSLAAATILPIPIAVIYMKSHKDESYTQSFVQSLILISIVVAAVMLVIGNNIARAFGLIGAVAIIRFRTKVKDPRDTTFLFLCITIGMACGLGLFYISIITTIFICCILVLLWKLNFGKTKRPG